MNVWRDVLFKCCVIVLLSISLPIYAKTLFFGDSLTYVIGNAYKKHNSDTDVDNYSVLSILFISRILHHNKNIEITWILPPTVKNDRKNELIQHTKTAIKKGMKPIGIRAVDPDVVFGRDYREKVDNKVIRTADGVHITNYGADLIVDLIY